MPSSFCHTICARCPEHTDAELAEIKRQIRWRRGNCGLFAAWGAVASGAVVEGEELALRRAYNPVEIDPLTVGLVEAHGTESPRCALAP